MRKLTQTRPDNCWQTCIAMLLDVSVEALPDQHRIGFDEFAPALQAYLYKHHGLAYLEIPPERFPDVRAQGVRHLIIGETKRTTPENDVWHAVVGVSGQPLWDVHPSRAGLTRVIKWGLLVSFPDEWRGMVERLSCACCACTGVAHSPSVDAEGAAWAA